MSTACFLASGTLDDSVASPGTKVFAETFFALSSASFVPKSFEASSLSYKKVRETTEKLKKLTGTTEAFQLEEKGEDKTIYLEGNEENRH